MPHPTVMLFDLGGVLVATHGRARLHALLPHLTDAQIQARWLESAAVDRFERGRIAPTEFATEFIAEWRLQMDGAQFIESFAGWVGDFFEGAKEIVRALSNDHRVACLSNTNAVHWARLQEANDLFDHCFVSHVMGHMKPDLAAYRHVLGALQVKPGDVWFFDDLAPNVAAARSLGINAFQVEGPEGIAAALRAAGIHARGRT